MGEPTGYPSPRSEPPGPLSTISSSEQASKVPPKSPTLAEPRPRPKLALKRLQDPPRNAAGEIYCDRPECRHKVPTFRRPCEWNKHMDKHDRPYKCLDPDCDKMQGFTYSGGLLRHQREVHKMHSRSQKLMCPYPDCNRSSGKGFTRQENLKEHLRRLHRGGEGRSPEMSTAELGESQSNHTTLPANHPSKRVRREHTVSTPPLDENNNTNSVLNLQDEVTKLRQETQDKDSRLDELEKIVNELRQMIKQSV